MGNHLFAPVPLTHGLHVASVSPSRKRKRKTMEREAVRSSCIEATHYCSQVDRKENSKLVSPFFNHEYPPGTKIEIASKKTDNANTLSASSDSNSQGKEIVVSPYFKHSYPSGTKIEIALKKTANAKVVSASDNNGSQGNKQEKVQKEKKQEKQSLAVSPYFNNSNYSKEKCKIVVKEKTIGRTPHYGIGNPSANAKVVSASDNNGSQGNKQEKVQKEKKQSLAVSPYFNNSNYSKEKCKIVVKEKTIGRTPHYGTGNPSSSSLSSIGREGEGCGGGRKFNPEKVQQEKQELVVSPYFDNSHYPKEKFTLVVKEKAIEKSYHHGTGNPFSSSSSLFSSRREGEGCSKSNRLNPFLEAYRRKSEHNYWTPPKSRYKLLQESYYQDPWKVLIICMLLNKTSGRQARQVISDLFTLCPDASSATKVEASEIEKIICSLGLQKKRSIMIQRFSKEYLRDDWTHVTQLHGIGKYAADAYAIFCTGFWRDVQPDDHKLVPYWEDLWKSEIIGNQT